jgi:cysteine synthase A
MAEALAAETPDALLTRQFSNPANAEAHELGTGQEIWLQLAANGTPPDAFVAGVGTGGTVMGVGRFLRYRRPSVLVYPLEPANSPTLSTGHKVGRHRIQGISDEFIPALVDLGFLDEVIAVDDGDAIRMAQALSHELGLAVGISSGANFLGALIAQQRLGTDAVVATVFSDSNKKYLSTDLMRDEPLHANDLTPRVTLRSFRTLARRCEICTSVR